MHEEEYEKKELEAIWLYYGISAHKRSADSGRVRTRSDIATREVLDAWRRCLVMSESDSDEDKTSECFKRIHFSRSLIISIPSQLVRGDLNSLSALGLRVDSNDIPPWKINKLHPQRDLQQ